MVAHIDESGVCGLDEAASHRRHEAIWDSIKEHVSSEDYLRLSLEDVLSLSTKGPSDPKSSLDRRKQLHELIEVRC